MNIDLYHEILFHLNINDIKNFCSCRKTLYLDTSFWVNLFKRDKLLLFTKQLKYDKWLDEYRKSLKASLIGKYLLVLLVKEAGNSIVNRFSYAYMTFLTKDIKPLLPEKLIEKYVLSQNNTSLIIKIRCYTCSIGTKEEHFKYFLSFINNNILLPYIEFSYNDILLLLTKIFYYFSSINVVDNIGDSYNKCSYDYKKLDDITLYWKYKKLNDRKLYWENKKVF